MGSRVMELQTQTWVKKVDCAGLKGYNNVSQLICARFYRKCYDNKTIKTLCLIVHFNFEF